MAEKWFISDTHFFHENIIKFCNRPFINAEHMNEFMISEWNNCVSPQDKVYHLGDVALGAGGNEGRLANLLRRLNGHKRLIVGNHDNLKSSALQTNFQKIDLWKGFKTEGFTCVHIPLEIDQLRDGDVCVHGHIHDNLKKGRYINVCVEHTKYRPMHMDEILERIKQL
jgi:calcineurin-like phosphoesterase family protein